MTTIMELDYIVGNVEREANPEEGIPKRLIKQWAIEQVHEIERDFSEDTTKPMLKPKDARDYWLFTEQRQRWMDAHGLTEEDVNGNHPDYKTRKRLTIYELPEPSQLDSINKVRLNQIFTHYNGRTEKLIPMKKFYDICRESGFTTRQWMLALNKSRGYKRDVEYEVGFTFDVIYGTIGQDDKVEITGECIVERR